MNKKDSMKKNTTLMNSILTAVTMRTNATFLMKSMILQKIWKMKRLTSYFTSLRM